jgi:hypothetical protein
LWRRPRWPWRSRRRPPPAAGGGPGGDGGDGGWAKVTNAEASQKFAKPKGKTNQAFLVRFLTLKDGIKDFRHGAVVLPMVVAIIINHCT